MTRQLPPSGINLFQLIYLLMDEYKSQSGLNPLNLSLGNPDLIPAPPVRELLAEFSKKAEVGFQTYAEDQNLNQFAEGMIRIHGGIEVSAHPHLKALPIAGIKTATAILPLACGLHLSAQRRAEFVAVVNAPAYDVAGTWSGSYYSGKRIAWPLKAEKQMRLDVSDLKSTLATAHVQSPHLIFVIRPGNPASVAASRQEWKELIEFCLSTGARLVNDAAYSGLADSHHVTLASVAAHYPELEWMELYSVSKSYSHPGARLGALVGSRDFVDDFRIIQGNTDSGPNPAVMAAYGQLFQNDSLARNLLNEVKSVYQKRLDYLVPTLKKAGFEPACETNAGFFTLWRTPRSVLGRPTSDWAKELGCSEHEAFNRVVIQRTGIVGVHFLGDVPLIRYAVCTDVLNPEFQNRFEKALSELRVNS